MQVGKSGSDEQLGRLVIRMLVDQVWINDNGRLERRHDLLQVGEEIHSRLWLARNCGFHVGDRRRVCDAAPVGLRCPYIHEDVRQSSVRIPKEDEVIRTQAEHVCCILRLLHSLVTDVPKLCGRDWRRPPEQRRTHDIVIARRHPQHSDLCSCLESVLDETRARDGLVVWVRRQNEDPIRFRHRHVCLNNRRDCRRKTCHDECRGEHGGTENKCSHHCRNVPVARALVRYRVSVSPHSNSV